MSRRPEAERFWRHANRGDGCWLWTAHRAANGYGVFRNGGQKLEIAHRAAYRLTFGAIPEGLVIDHLCRTKACVNPSHLEAVTQAENMRRSEPATKSHCPHGHEFNEVNAGVSRGHRHCRPCKAMRSRVWRAKKREGVA